MFEKWIHTLTNHRPLILHTERQIYPDYVPIYEPIFISWIKNTKKNSSTSITRNFQKQPPSLFLSLSLPRHRIPINSTIYISRETSLPRWRKISLSAVCLLWDEAEISDRGWNDRHRHRFQWWKGCIVVAAWEMGGWGRARWRWRCRIRGARGNGAKGDGFFFYDGRMICKHVDGCLWRARQLFNLIARCYVGTVSLPI